jgi:ElaB/YqjD/DUF883 family membrane-anchored ribosome-binding protein
MEPTAKILKFKDKKLETVEEVRAALTAILEDIESGDVTVSEATPIRDEIEKMMREIRAQMKSAKPEDDALLKLFFGG